MLFKKTFEGILTSELWVIALDDFLGLFNALPVASIGRIELLLSGG